jgi:flavodoxin
MQIRKMFNKQIDRDIKGVIKVGQDDETVMKPELEEYVVTNELRGHFDDFFTAYKKGIVGHTDKMGVWISGFFGSGKSHFLKMLSYLLENRTVDHQKAIAYFADKMEDPMVLAEMKQASDISTDVILFNIDSKSDSDSKLDKEAIVTVFMKVFNEKQGFCGSIPWLADLERQMVKDGTYEAFKAEFQVIADKEWTEAREDLFYEEEAILEALAKTTKMSLESARNWYNKADEIYSLSIEKFAHRVREYIQGKGKNHHVVFLVDEIGQYIGDNSQLMLNLQTVTEDLGTLCGGKVWVIVTSQQDLDAVIKTKGKLDNNSKEIDFSKIQGRFNTRITLSSANVDEVIKKRILDKNPTAKASLKLLYQQKNSILKNLITFSADTAEMKNYAHEEDFVNVYPFIPYQFNLLQSVFTGIRIHGASGRSLSEGERSLLSAFQESAIRYADAEMGTLVPFTAFYETIESFLDSNIRTVIIHAQQNSRLIPEDIELLKLLFLIKYPKEMPSDIDNIATLLLAHVDDDKLDIKKRIEESLKRLIRETLIQKNGEEYVFLTHEEQDVNKEIKNMKVDSADVLQKVGDILFTEIYSDKKFKYSNKYDFAFNTLLDDRVRGTQNNEIGIRIITPYYEGGMDISQQGFKLLSARENHVIVRLLGNTAFLDEVEEALKIQAYLRLKSGSTTSQAIEDIKTRKARETSTRFVRAETMLKEGLKTAEIYVASQLLDIKEKSPVERINDAFRILVDTLYYKINYVKAFIDTDKELYDISTSQTVQLALMENDPNKLAMDEMDGYIERNTIRNIPVTVRSATTLFSKAPYGWREKDISAILLKLFKAQEIRLQYNSEYIAANDKESINYVTKRDYTEKVLIKKRDKIDAKLINNVKKLCKDLFNYSALPGDEDSLMQRFKDLVRDEISDIRELVVYYGQANYPGKEVLTNGKQAFEQIISIKDIKMFFEKANALADDFLDYGEDAEEVKNFFKNQRGYYDKALKSIGIFDKNKTYVLDEQAVATIEKIRSITKNQKPYADIPKLPSLIDEFTQRFVELLEAECTPVKEVIQCDWQKVREELALQDFKEQLAPCFSALFSDLLSRIEKVNHFYEAIAMKEESDRIKLKCLNEIVLEQEKRKSIVLQPPVGGGTIGKEKPAVYVTRKTVNVSINNMLHGANTIENAEDIEKLLRGIRTRLQAELKENTIIKLV